MVSIRASGGERARFNELRVLAFESRHSEELDRLIRTYGGQPTVVPALREVPQKFEEARAFASGLVRGNFDVVIFLTGAGTRSLIGAIESDCSPERFTAALQTVRVVARGPKPVSALREIGVVPNLVAPEPNTWREVLHVLDGDSETCSLEGVRVAVQEYGIPCTELLSGLRERGAKVTRVPIYRWSLPEDLAPLQTVVRSIAAREFDIALFTSAVQARHLFQVASEISLEESVRNSLERMVVASIGPTTSDALVSLGLQPDLESSHPRMGVLVREAAERSADILQEKHNDPGLDFLHEIGSRMASGSPLREVLGLIVDCSATVVECDSCFIYVLEGDELILRASRNPHPLEIDRLKLRLGEGITGWVAKHRRPVAIASHAFHDPRFQLFNELPEDRYESFLSVPILCRDRLVGVINLQRREPHSYARQEIRLIATIGFLVGAEIERARSEERTAQLSEELEARKEELEGRRAIERAKGILQQNLKLSESEAYFSLRRQSRQARKSMREIAEAIVNEELGRGPGSKSHLVQG